MFKCFKFIDVMLKQLNEADEMPTEDEAAGSEEAAGGEAGAEEAAPQGDMGAEGGQEMGGEELPDDYVCPLCKHGAADFEPIE